MCADVCLAVFNREQQHAQKAAAGAQQGQRVDLVAYVEFQRNYRLALKVHKDALLAMRAFWSLLLHSKVRFEALADAVNKVDTAIKDADRSYK